MSKEIDIRDGTMVTFHIYPKGETEPFKLSVKMHDGLLKVEGEGPIVVLSLARDNLTIGKRLW